MCWAEVRQLDSGVVHQETRGHSVSNSVHRGVEVAEVVQRAQCVVEAEAHRRNPEHYGRPTVQAQGGTNGVDTVSSSGRVGVLDFGKTTDRSVCNRTESPAANFLQQIPGTRVLSSGRSGNELGRNLGVCVPTNSVSSKSTTQGARQQKLQNVASGAGVATKALVHGVGANAVQSTSSASRTGRSVVSEQGQDSTPKSRIAQTSGEANIKQKLRAKGFSKTARNLYCAAIRKSTQSAYEGRFNEFICWCQRLDSDPFSCDVEVIVNFLASLFKRTPKLTHSTICGYRTAISSFHDVVEGKRAGDLPEVSIVMKGIFNLRLPIKAGLPLWDLDVVLKGLQKPPFEPMLSVGPKWLTLKAVFLVAMATACRSSDIRMLSCEEPFLHERRAPKSYVLMPVELKKQSRPKHLSEEIVISVFQDNRLLDPFRALTLYLKRVKAERKGVKSLFVTFKIGEKVSPSAQTISRWLTEVIKITYMKQNVTLDKIKRNGHTTRAASMSWALFNGASVDSILKAADWGSQSVFARHYLKKLEDSRSEFSREVLGHKPTSA